MIFSHRKIHAASPSSSTNPLNSSVRYARSMLNTQKKHMKTSCGQGLKISSDKKDCVELDCRDSGCMNGGRCLSHSLGFKCKCPKSYAGKFCEAEASPYGSIHASLGFIVTLIACASSLICKYYMFTQFISFRYDDSISSRQRRVHH